MTIGWLEISKRKYGGVVYNEEARHALKKSFDLETIFFEPKIFKNLKYLRIPESLFYLCFLKGKKDFWIRDFYSTLTMPFDRTSGKNIVAVHHDDFSGFPIIARPIFKIAQQIFYRNLKKVDAIVAVSEYWRKYFLEKGYKNVYKIYNAFDSAEFDISATEVEDFKKRYNLTQKPIVYLGNCQRAKGVVDAYNELKGLDVYLVTSGRPMVKISAINLNLDYRDYLRLLKASSVVLTMSKFKEGWCRTAHEAMLCKTPVIGSGLGGMSELLEGGKQIICPDIKSLKDKVIFLLNNTEARKKMGEEGYNFAKDFTKEKFQEDWINLINKISNNDF